MTVSKMTSWPTRKLFHFMDIASYCKFIPYYQDLRDYSSMITVDEDTGIKTYHPFIIWIDRRHRIRYLLVNAFTLSARLVALALGISYHLRFSVGLVNQLQFYYICSVHALMLLLQLAVLAFSGRLYSMQNTYFLFNFKLYELHKLDKWEKDGVEIYLKFMISANGLAVAFTPIYIVYMDLISALSAIICFYNQLHVSIVILVSIGIIAIFVLTETLFKLANYVTDISLEFRNSFLRNDFSLEKFERLRFNSCKGLDIYAGSLFKVSRHTYITFLNDVVLDNVVNLIIELGS